MLQVSILRLVIKGPQVKCEPPKLGPQVPSYATGYGAVDMGLDATEDIPLPYSRTMGYGPQTLKIAPPTLL